MKQVAWRKTAWSVLFVVLLGLFLSVNHSSSAQAATVKLTRNHFDVSYVGSSSIGIDLNLPYSDIKAEVRLYEGSKLVAKTTAITYASLSYKVKKNKVYYYRCRPIYNGKYCGNWSAKKAFTTMQFVLSSPSKSGKIVKVKVPKIAGIKSVKVQMSKSKTSGFKNVATLKPGRSKQFSSFKGSSFAYYTTYYVKGKITLKNGIPCKTMYVQNFSWRKVTV